MGHFEKRGNFGGKRFGGEKQMFDATCAECGKHCQVPFKPNGKKPVLCRDCFGGGDKQESFFEKPRFEKSRRDFGGRDDRPRFEEKRMFSATCSECGNRCEVPFKPSGEKPVYCNNCFAASRGQAPRGEGRSMEPKTPANQAEFEALNAKLDRILKTLEIIQGKKEYVIDKTPAKEEKKAEKPAKEESATKEKKASKSTKKKK